MNDSLELHLKLFTALAVRVVTGDFGTLGSKKWFSFEENEQRKRLESIHVI
jgi:hypothetical protein